MKLIKRTLGLRKLEHLVYGYSSHFAAPTRANLIDALCVPPIPDLIKVQPNSNKSNKIPHFFPPLWTSSTSRRLPESALCHKCSSTGPPQLKWAMSKTRLWGVITSLHHCSKRSQSHGSKRVLIQAPGCARWFAEPKWPPRSSPVASLIDYL